MDLEILSEEEEVALEKFRKMVSDLNQEDETLLRFLRARDLHLDKAEEMLRKSLKWREDNRMDSYVNWVLPKALADDYIYEYLGTDNEGYGVMYVPLGRWNIRDRMEEGYLEDTYNFRFYFIEAVLMPQVKKTRRFQGIFIVDAAGLNFHKVAHVNTINFCIKCAQEVDANHPERLRAVFFINASWVFTYGYSLLKPWMAPKTIEKLQVFDTNKYKWFPAITKTIPMDILPQQLLS